MTKTEALKLIVESKATSPSTRSFIAWLYKNGYEIRKLPMDAYSITVRANARLQSACQSIEDVTKIDGMTVYDSMRPNFDIR